MQTTKQKSTSRLKQDSQKKLGLLFATLAENIEVIMDELGEYKPSFVQGLKQAHKQASKNKLKKLHSLLDLM